MTTDCYAKHIDGLFVDIDKMGAVLFAILKKIRINKRTDNWFLSITDAANPNNGQREKVMIVWRKLTGDLEKDNLMLDEWFWKNRAGTQDFKFDTIYVNGSNNLPNMKQAHENWKVRLIEEEFMKRMWDVEGI